MNGDLEGTEDGGIEYLGKVKHMFHWHAGCLIDSACRALKLTVTLLGQFLDCATCCKYMHHFTAVLI